VGTPIEEVVEQYTDLAKWMVERWSAHSSKLAAKVDDGTYDADTAVAGLAAAASLATETAARLAWEALEAVTILTSRLGPNIVESHVFSTSLAGAKLKLKDDLVNGFGDPLPTDVVKVIPSELGPNETEFRLRADATDCPAGTYIGAVVASKPGNPDDEVTVHIPVP